MGVIDMVQQRITAYFENGEALNTALWGLRQAGAMCHTGDIPYAGAGGGATLHLTVPSSETMMARYIIRRAGGKL